MWPLTSASTVPHPISLAGAVSHDPGMASHVPAYWFLSMQLSASSNLNPIGIVAAHLTIPTNHRFLTPFPNYQHNYLQAAQQPSANPKKTGKIYNYCTPSSQPTSYLQHLQLVANPLCKFYLPRHQSGFLASFLSCVQTWKNSKFLFSCFL